MEIVKDVRIQKIAHDARNTVEYKEEKLFLEITERIVALMDEGKVSKAELARRLGCTPAYITKLLSGSTNFTVSTLLRISDALNAELNVSLDGMSESAFGSLDVSELLRLIKRKTKNNVEIVYLGVKDGVLTGLRDDAWVDVQVNQDMINKATKREAYYDKFSFAS